MFPTLLRFISENLWLLCFGMSALAVVSIVIAIRGKKWWYLAAYVVVLGVSLWGGWRFK